MGKDLRKKYVRPRLGDTDKMRNKNAYRINVRMDRSTSARLASLQGMLFKFCEKETFNHAFATVCMPALAAYCLAHRDAYLKAREAIHDS